jgi:hypothetical protein
MGLNGTVNSSRASTDTAPQYARSAGDEPGLDRPVLGASESQGSASRQVHDETLCIAAVFDQDPQGFFEGDTVAHCGPTLKGEFARTVNLTCVHTGWTWTRTVRNNAHTHILAALKTAVEQVAFEVVGLDFDNGTEFLNKAVINWAGQRQIFFTRSRPYKKNDQATVESKNNHLVRKYGFYYRYDTPEERAVLNRLWPLVNDRLNYLTPTKKPTGYASSRDGRRRRLYDTPQTPLDRLLAAKVLSPAQRAQLIAHRDSLNPAKIAREIADLQTRLMVLAKEKTEQLYLASIPTALPDIRKGIRVKAS